MYTALRTTFLLLSILILSACNEDSVRVDNDNNFDENIKITQNNLSNIRDYDYFNYEGTVTIENNNNRTNSFLNVYKNYHYYDNSHFEEIIEYNSDFNLETKSRIISQNSEGNLILKELPYSNICFNYNEYNYICNGVETLHYFPDNNYYYSIENNSFTLNDIDYFFDVYFEYQYKTTIYTNLGNIETKKIWFETFSVNSLNEIVKVYGHYYINPSIGIIKKTYTEEEINTGKSITYDYTLTETNKK